MITIRLEYVRVTDRDVRELERDIIMPDLERRATNMQRAMVVPKHTGRLASSVRKNRGRTATGPHVDVVVGRAGLTDYLGYILNGTPPHVITPRDRQVLRFMAGGRVVFAQRVHHPGTSPNNFMIRALPAALR